MTHVENLKYLERFFGLSGEDLVYKLMDMGYGLQIEGEMVSLVEIN